MRLARSFLVLAVLAALIGAPPSASAASNTLHSPAATPGSGTTATVFRLRVRYEGRFAALAVQANVAGLALPMGRIAGSRTDGTWESLASLPAGTWSVSFSAIVERGNPPILTGPTLTVAALVTTTPTPEPEPEPAPEPSGGNGAPGGGGSEPDARVEPADDEQPASPPRTTPDGAPADEPSTDAAPTGDDKAPAQPEPAGDSAPDGEAPGSGSSDSAGVGGSTGSGDAGHGAPGSRPTPSDEPGGRPGNGGDRERGDASIAPTEGASGSEPEATVASDNDLVTGAIRAATVSTALLVGAMGLFFALAARRRRHDAAEEDAVAVAADTEALLARRARRRARVLIPDDPIVAAMDLDEGDTAAQRASRRRVRRRAERERGP